MYKKNLKLVTVIATYNGAEWIKWCLDSLVSSQMPTKVIVVDNNSTDRTKEIIKSNFPHVRLIEQNRNLGFGKANNIGLKIAIELNADNVFLLNQDAKVEPNTLGILVNAQQRHKNYGIVSPVHFNGFGTELDTYFSKYLLASNIDAASLKNHQYKTDEMEANAAYPIGFVNAAGWLLSRECIETVGGFDPLFNHYGEDNNYLNRVRYHSFEVGIVPRAIMYHDRGNRGGSSDKNPFAREMDIFRRSLLIDALNPQGDNKVYEIKKELRILKRKAFLTFDRNKVRLQSEIYQEFSAMVDTIYEHCTLSKTKGRTYL